MSSELHVASAERPVWFARLGFLLFIKELSQETWDSLRDDVLPSYRRLASLVDSYSYAFASDATKIELLSQRSTEYTAAFKTWQRIWHLRDDWVIQEATMALELWRTHGPDEALDLIGVFFSNLAAIQTEKNAVEALGIPPPSLVVDAWNPTREGWFHYRGRALDRIRQELADYRVRIAGLPGLAEWPRKRDRAGRGADRHLQWLVRFQVKEEEQQAIADDPTGDGSGPRVEVDAVQKAIRSTAEFIGLTRRSLDATHQ